MSSLLEEWIGFFPPLGEVGSPPEKLAMNQADGFRAVQEQRCVCQVCNDFNTAI